MKRLVPDFQGLAILDGDKLELPDENNNGLEIIHWQHYEIENYYISPNLILKYVASIFDQEGGLFTDTNRIVMQEIIEARLLDNVFGGDRQQLAEYKKASANLQKTLLKGLKMSSFAERVFEEFSARQDQPVFLRKGEYYRMIACLAPEEIPEEVNRKLDKLARLFSDISENRIN